MLQDIHYFPHVCEQIVWSAPSSALPCLRAVSPVFRDLVDRRLAEHIMVFAADCLVTSSLLPHMPIPGKVRWDEVRVLELVMSLDDLMDGTGNAKAPWVIDEQPGGSEVLLPEALPHLPRLQVVRCLNYQPTVFPHVLRYTSVPLVVYPASRAISWSPRASAGGRIVGGNLHAPRAVISFSRAPGGNFSFYFHADQHEYLTIVLLPGEWGDIKRPLNNNAPPAHTGPQGRSTVVRRPEDLSDWPFWVCLTDEISHHIVENQGRCEIVGLEAWSDPATRDETWADMVVRDVGLEDGKERLMFSTLEQWKKDNEEIWPLVAQTPLA